ncbi:hypothetical protein OHS71_07190 [Streptomyces sp. NBC_00377]|uniref:hypothetical protein n=1 Tax=unclassified Streptomyces TaxID=2593676 RepID=UPI002E206563|nr:MULTISPECIES: hypothetical protein [unclassified Streptomyces]
MPFPPVAGGRWPVAGGRWLVAGGRWAVTLRRATATATATATAKDRYSTRPGAPEPPGAANASRRLGGRGVPGEFTPWAGVEWVRR